MNVSDAILPFFSPRGVVVVGASAEPTKLGYGVARVLSHSTSARYTRPRPRL